MMKKIAAVISLIMFSWSLKRKSPTKKGLATTTMNKKKNLTKEPRQ
jgi:hypothetical protein